MKYLPPKKRLQRRRRGYVYTGITVALGLWLLSQVDYSSLRQKLLVPLQNQFSLEGMIQSPQGMDVPPPPSRLGQSQQPGEAPFLGLEGMQGQDQSFGEMIPSSGSLEGGLQFGSDPRFSFEEPEQLSKQARDEFEARLLEKIALQKAANVKDIITNPYQGRKRAGRGDANPEKLYSPIHLSEARKIHFESQKDVGQDERVEKTTQAFPKMREATAQDSKLHFDRETSYIVPRFAFVQETKRDALILLDISSSMDSFLDEIEASTANERKTRDEIRARRDALEEQLQHELDPLRAQLRAVELRYENVYQKHGKICQELLDALSSNSQYRKDFPSTFRRMQRRIPYYIRIQDHCIKTLAARKREVEQKNAQKSSTDYSPLIATLNALQQRQKDLGWGGRAEEHKIRTEMYALRRKFRAQMPSLPFLHYTSFSFPSAAAIAIARYYIEEKGTTVSGMLFNKNAFYTGYTDDLEKLASFFSQRSNGETYLNGKLMMTLASDPSRPNRNTPLDMYIISDFELGAIESTIEQIKGVTDLGRIYVLEVGGSRGTTTALFGDDFYRVPLRRYEDLQNFYQRFVKEMKPETVTTSPSQKNYTQ